MTLICKQMNCLIKKCWSKEQTATYHQFLPCHPQGDEFEGIAIEDCSGKAEEETFIACHGVGIDAVHVANLKEGLEITDH